jgi:hypothetical protein
MGASVPCELCAIKGGWHIEADGGCRHRWTDADPPRHVVSFYNRADPVECALAAKLMAQGVKPYSRRFLPERLT